VKVIFFVVRKGIPSCVPRNGSERNSENLHLFWFHGTDSELCSLPHKGSEQNYGCLLLFLFHGTELRVIFSSAEGFGTEFRDFLFRGTTGISSEITICSVYSVFRGKIFLSEIPNPRCAVAMRKSWSSVADCMKFLTTDHKDDLEIKMALVKKIADPATLCTLCTPPKE
jgi:hypothetical protein